MPRVGFEPAFERTKTFHVSDRAAPVIGAYTYTACRIVHTNVLDVK
jgi:hypothetical protein